MFSFGLSFVWLWLFDMLFSVGIFEGDGTSSTAVKHWYMPIARIKMRMNGFRLRNHFKLWHFQLRSLSLILFLCVFVFIFDVYLCAHSIEGVHYRWAVSFFYDDFYRRSSQCRHSLICEVAFSTCLTCPSTVDSISPSLSFNFSLFWLGESIEVFLITLQGSLWKEKEQYETALPSE